MASDAGASRRGRSLTSSDVGRYLGGSVAAAGAPIQIATDSGEVLTDYTSAKSYSSLVFTSADLSAGAEYTIVLDGDHANRAVDILNDAGPRRCDRKPVLGANEAEAKMAT